MSSKKITMNTDNDGVTCRINLFSLRTYLDDHDAMSASLYLRGDILNAETGIKVKFQNPGELLTVLSRWNRDKFKQLKRKTKSGRAN